MTTPAATPAPNGNGRPHQLLGYAAGHVLDDNSEEGALIEWFEDERGRVPAHHKPDDARKACDDDGGDPEVWDVIELRIVPRGGA